MKSLKEFLEEKLNEKGIRSKRAFAKMLKINAQALQTQLNRNSIGMANAIEWARILECTLEEIISHTNLNKENTSLIQEPEDQYGNKPNTIISPKQIFRNMVQLPYLSVNHQNKFVMKNNPEISQITETHDVNMQEEIDLKDCIVFEINDEQMEPTILKNSKILVRLVNPEHWQFCQNSIYVVNYARTIGTFRIKSNTLNESKTLILHSDNSKYGEIKIPSESIKNIFHLVAVIWSIPK
jgi:phage repressor protein C with HTH and peptisase S24 domain